MWLEWNQWGAGGGGSVEGDNAQEVTEPDHAGLLNRKAFEFYFEMENFRKVFGRVALGSIL